jgi:hypothetical protein
VERLGHGDLLAADVLVEEAIGCKWVASGPVVSVQAAAGCSTMTLFCASNKKQPVEIAANVDVEVGQKSLKFNGNLKKNSKTQVWTFDFELQMYILSESPLIQILMLLK